MGNQSLLDWCDTWEIHQDPHRSFLSSVDLWAAQIIAPGIARRGRPKCAASPRANRAGPLSAARCCPRRAAEPLRASDRQRNGRPEGGIATRQGWGSGLRIPAPLLPRNPPSDHPNA
jgi:hypothetical protein